MMGLRANGLREGVRGAVRFIILGLLFSLVYGQSPLYTSNQNQYFLHAAARAGIGLLSDDWLANTIDRLQNEYRVTHVVLDRDLFDLSCPALGPRLYADEAYAVHELIAL